MAEQKIEFRKIRDFGEILNDTFLFIRLNFKLLFKSFFSICAVFMIVQAIFYGIYQSQSLNVFNKWLFGNIEMNEVIQQVISLEFVIWIFFKLITLVAMKVALGSFIKYYVENNGRQPEIEEVWTIFKKYFFRILLYSIPLNLLIILGYFCCLFPCIYLWVVFAPFSLVVMMEEKKFSGAFDRCFELISKEFWISFAVYLTGYLIYSFSGGVIEILVSIAVGLVSFFTTENLEKTTGILSSFLSIFSYCFYTIFFLCITFHYFNLVEKRDGTGILKRINSIGDQKDNINNIEEQY